VGLKATLKAVCSGFSMNVLSENVFQIVGSATENALTKPFPSP